MNKKSILKKVLIIPMIAASFVTSINGEVYEDHLLTTPGTTEVLQHGMEADGYTLGLMAYTWGYPLVRMERVIREYTQVDGSESPTSYRAPLNQIGWATELATPSAKDMPTANNDTLYMSSVVNLNEPYILTVPDTNDRYYVVNVFNMWHELEHYIGRRTTGTEAGKYAIVPPNWEGELPKDVTILEVDTDKVWLWGRLHVLDGEDIVQLAYLQDGFTITPLSEINNPDYVPPQERLEDLPSIEGNELGFYKHLAYAINENGVREEDKVLFDQFKRIGLTEDGFDPNNLPKEVLEGIKRAYVDGPSVANAAMASNSMVENRQGWTVGLGLDNFGYNYPLRTLISGAYLGGNGDAEALYPIRYTDNEGNKLNGKNDYVIKFKEDLPVGAFWSLTIYNAEDKMLVENPINRYKVGSDTLGLTKRRDGSFEIPLSYDRVFGEFSTNWLPIPQGDFYAMFRLYQPDGTLISGEYELPQLEIVK